jgi:hypothetical protein
MVSEAQGSARRDCSLRLPILQGLRKAPSLVLCLDQELKTDASSILAKYRMYLPLLGMYEKVKGGLTK